MSRPSNPKARLWWLALILTLLPPASLALPEDREQPVYIESDRAERDGQKGVAIYEGDVQLRQGSLEIRAQRVTIHTNENGELERVLAEGAPAEFEQILEPNDPPVEARAQRIEYRAASEQLELQGEARLKQGEATMSGNRMEYNLASERLQAEGEDDDSRIQIVLPPRGERDSED